MCSWKTCKSSWQSRACPNENASTHFCTACRKKSQITAQRALLPPYMQITPKKTSWVIWMLCLLASSKKVLSSLQILAIYLCLQHPQWIISRLSILLPMKNGYRFTEKLFFHKGCWSSESWYFTQIQFCFSYQLFTSYSTLGPSQQKDMHHPNLSKSFLQTPNGFVWRWKPIRLNKWSCVCLVIACPESSSSSSSSSPSSSSLSSSSSSSSSSWSSSSSSGLFFYHDHYFDIPWTGTLDLFIFGDFSPILLWWITICFTSICENVFYFFQASNKQIQLAGPTRREWGNESPS